MGKLRNWLLAAILALLGSADLILGVFVELVDAAGLPQYYIQVFRITALLLTVVLMKQQEPSIKQARSRKAATPKGPPIRPKTNTENY